MGDLHASWRAMVIASEAGPNPMQRRSESSSCDKLPLEVRQFVKGSTSSGCLTLIAEGAILTLTIG